MEAAIAERVEQFLAAVAAESGGPSGAPSPEDGVDVHQELTELILDGRSIRSISAADGEALKKFANLSKLTLNQTGLASLANLPSMASVRTLEATDNHISSGLEHLVKAFPNLRRLQLGGNHIKTLADLDPLAKNSKQPTELFSPHSFSEVQQLLLLQQLGRSILLCVHTGALSQLEQLGLDLNPVASLPDYREKVFGLLPSLQILDARDRQGEEREAVESDSEEEDEGEELDTTLKEFYNADLPEEDVEDAEDFEPACDEEEDEEEGEEDDEELEDGVEGVPEEDGEEERQQQQQQEGDVSPEKTKRKLDAAADAAEAAAASKAARQS
ncbi:hypothetical protein Esti_001310 [Eimeria stiedai]